MYKPRDPEVKITEGFDTVGYRVVGTLEQLEVWTKKFKAEYAEQYHEATVTPPNEEPDLIGGWFVVAVRART